jgi:hypothetical protein
MLGVGKRGSSDAAVGENCGSPVQKLAKIRIAISEGPCMRAQMAPSRSPRFCIRWNTGTSFQSGLGQTFQLARETLNW